MTAEPDPSATPYTGNTTGEVTIPAEDATVTSITSVPSNTTTHYLARRLVLAFRDLGFREQIPSDWIQPCADGIAFRSLNLRDADKLVLAFEDLVRGRGLGRRVIAGRNQLRLFDGP